MQPAPAAAWQAVPGHLTTEWTAKVDPRHPLPEYPRPQMTRPQWVNLNGLWDYAVTAKDAPAPAKFEGRILVPFGIESALSGVKKPLGPEQRFWYRRNFTTPDLSGGKRLLLHFGAVAWQATVYVNGKSLGQHQGGYDGFTLDVTDAMKAAEKKTEKPPACGAGVSPAPATGTAAPQKPRADQQKPAGKADAEKKGEPEKRPSQDATKNVASLKPSSLTPGPSPAYGRGEAEKKKTASQPVAAEKDRKDCEPAGCGGAGQKEGCGAASGGRQGEEKGDETAAEVGRRPAEGPAERIAGERLEPLRHGLDRLRPASRSIPTASRGTRPPAASGKRCGWRPCRPLPSSGWR